MFCLSQCLQVTGNWYLFMMWIRSQCSLYTVCPPQFIKNILLYLCFAKLPCHKSSVHMCVVLFLFSLEFHWCIFHSLYQILHCINCYIFIINHDFCIVHVPFLFFSSMFGYSWSFALLHIFKNQFLAFIKKQMKISWNFK